MASLKYTTDPDGLNARLFATVGMGSQYPGTLATTRVRPVLGSTIRTSLTLATASTRPLGLYWTTGAGDPITIRRTNLPVVASKIRTEPS